MRRFVSLGAGIAAFAMLALASGTALAQKTDIVKFSGTASGAGTVTRTITDVPEPNRTGDGPQQIQSTVVTVTVTPGQDASIIGNNFRGAINANATLQAMGYSCVFSEPNGVQDPTRPKMVKQAGNYSVIDGNSTPGVTFAPSIRTVLDAPVLSPVGLGLLFGALPAVAFWRRRRKDA